VLAAALSAALVGGNAVSQCALRIYINGELFSELDGREVLPPGWEGTTDLYYEMVDGHMGKPVARQRLAHGCAHG
jgi:hypothetical protein